MRLGSDSGLFAFGIDGVGLNSIDNGLVEVSEEILVSGDGSDIAFPDADDAPALCLQLGFIANVAGDVALNLCFPILGI